MESIGMHAWETSSVNVYQTPRRLSWLARTESIWPCRPEGNLSMFPTQIYTKYVVASSSQLVLNTALKLSKVGETEFVL